MIEQKQLNNGFKYIEISNTSARAKIALQGAHLFHYQRPGQDPLLWVSETSFFKAGKAIRGGVPVCWPWFGKHKTDSSLPQHGFARTSVWTLLETAQPDAGTTEIRLQLKNSAETLQLWPYQFELVLSVTIAETLTIALTTTNRDQQPFTVSSALHSYFTVTDIDHVFVEGLNNTPYFDAVQKIFKTQQGKIIIDREVDRVYQNVQQPLLLHDQKRTVQVGFKGSSSAVVWNPWTDKSAAMGDMVDNGYKTMLCIEIANALNDARTIAPGDTHTLTAVIT